MERQIILASTSPRRIELMNYITGNFEAVPSNYEEDNNHTSDPIKLVKNHSLGKAKSLEEQFPNAIIIGADTIVYHDKKILGKPSSLSNAKEMLVSLSGKTHSVFTGVTILDAFKKLHFSNYCESKVTFKDLPEEYTDWYISTREPLDRAGAYAIQGIGCGLIKSFEGDYQNIIGLPVDLVKEMLKRLT